MRIVSGRWAGRSLASPGGRIRPTAEGVRDAAMLMVADELRGARVLDLFAGTGAMGLEALSRGARSCDFIENGAGAIHSLKANVAALHARPRSRIFLRDVIPFVERLPADAYDIAFADPPYGSRKLDRVLQRWTEVPFSRVFVAEHAPDHVLPVRGMSRRVGENETMITIFRARRAGREQP
ncbi:MAG: RsmD family RNA methyltransferase [Longimicrobiales bacterium]